MVADYPADGIEGVTKEAFDKMSPEMQATTLDVHEVAQDLRGLDKYKERQKELAADRLDYLRKREGPLGGSGYHGI